MPQFDKKVWKFPGKVSLTLEGHSRGAEATCFRIPELGWCLDAGIEVYGTVTHVFLSHGHMDHAQSLPCLLQRRQHTTYYAPEGVAKFAQGYMVASFAMNDASDTPYPRNYSMIPVTSSQKYEIKQGKKTYYMKPVDCVHTVPSVGFCFWEPRQKLKEEYKSMSGKEIGELRKNGVEVSENFDVPMFVFMGDTSVKVFDLNPYPIPHYLFMFIIFDSEKRYI